MAKLNQAKKLLLISNEGEFEKSGSEPLNDDHESISSRSNVHSITRNVDQGCSLFDGINRCYSAAESNAWQQSLEPINDTVAIENLDTYSYFDGENHSHYAIGDTSNSKKKDTGTVDFLPRSPSYFRTNLLFAVPLLESKVSDNPFSHG